MTKCPACTQRVVSTYEGFQEWCVGCGRLFWVNPDGSIRGTQVPTIIAAHERCHDQHGKVDARAFADLCAAEQRKLYGCAPDADAVQTLENRINELEAQNACIAKGDDAW